MTEAQATIQWLIEHKGYKMDEFYTIGDVQEATEYLNTTERTNLNKFVKENTAYESKRI